MDSRPSQKHRILRQVLEVRGCARADAHRLQSDIRAAYDRLLPSIERTCSELSTPGRLDRIDRLEIDLGEVPPDALESAVVDGFDRVFESRLAESIRTADSKQTDADLELFSYFVRTGTVPWWADLSDRRLLETSLDASIKHAARALRRAIALAPDQKAVWRRIALTYPDRLLDELLGVLASPVTTAYPGVGTEWLTLIETGAAEQRYSMSLARTLWWEELLRASLAATAPVPAASRFFRPILSNVANRLGIAYHSFISNLNRTLERPSLSLQPWVRDVVERLHQDALTASGKSPTSYAEATRHGRDDGRLADAVPVDAFARTSKVEVERLLAQCEEASSRLDDALWMRLQTLVARLPPRERERALTRIRRTPAGAARLEEFATLLREFPVGDDSRPREDVALGRDSNESEPRAPIDLAFSDIDEIYVENAGLVLLWPFLENFFRHLDLLEENQFRDSGARQRAVGLLQYIASEDAAAPEYLVPLNKVLCGMPIDDIFDFGPPIAAGETDACAELVAAAIHHAPILRDMSVEGFRGSFLLRRGQLSIRDGSWLLRVERETYDIVIDRFPWSVSIVKLPWMAAIMPVEW